MEMQFAFDEDETGNLSPSVITPIVPVAVPVSGTVFKRQFSDDDGSPSGHEDVNVNVVNVNVNVTKQRAAADFADLTFKDVPEGDSVAPPTSAAISIPNAPNAKDGVASSNDGARRRKKRRPLDLGRPRRFDELYEPTGEQLGAGAYSTVATYRDRRTQREYAVKRIEKRSYAIRTRVFKEIEIFNACAGHPHVLQLIEFHETDKEFYLVFEKMYGGTLLHAIHERGHLSEAEARDVVLQIAEALSMLHKRGIAHRDLKPENILCEFAGKLHPVKIGDFDLGSDVPLARRSHTSSGTSAASSVANRTGSIVVLDDEDSDSISTPPLLTPVGSLEYMAPEVVDTWMGEASMYDKKCDVWSLGVILYILLSGKPPFYGQCGQQCGWEQGGSCYTCQTMLCERIQRGEYEFPECDWRSVSHQAIDLVRRMLVREPHRRASIEEILQHGWFSLPLQTVSPVDKPRPISRKASLAGLASYAENANALNRLIAQQHNGAHYTVSCYLPSPRFDDQLSELLELDADAVKPAVKDADADADADSIVPTLEQTQLHALSNGEPQSALTAADRSRLVAAMGGRRTRVRLPSCCVGTGNGNGNGNGASNLAQAARRHHRLLSRSVDNMMHCAANRDASPRFAPHAGANHDEAIQVRH